MKSKTHSHGGNGHDTDGASATGGGGGGGGSCSSPSPPPSPRRHSGISHCRRRLRPVKSISNRSLGTLAAGIMTRRSLRYFFLLPLLYISGLLMCVGPFSAFIGGPPLPGSVYRSHEVFRHLWPAMESDNSSAIVANGGLNQQRSAICNAVAVAGLLNAILVIPHFEFHNVWKDPRRPIFFQFS
ncbi:hypothetical protein Ahy_A10g049111 isoform C [Arachis hypogaea]|uniref:O-fucosyltransferase family protein n=1 Tax=Arachis hypogaea TaxID=3818 RepID=A0A445B6I5_ARAHY|nr:hypothetical protein Ahy_A10g049111 isoform C [Arachis hypogaea]